MLPKDGSREAQMFHLIRRTHQPIDRFVDTKRSNCNFRTCHHTLRSSMALHLSQHCSLHIHKYLYSLLQFIKLQSQCSRGIPNQSPKSTNIPIHNSINHKVHFGTPKQCTSHRNRIHYRCIPNHHHDILTPLALPPLARPRNRISQ